MFPVVVMHEGTELPEDTVYYAIGENGIFLRKKMGLIDCMVPVKKISILKKLEPYAEMNVTKIPDEDFAKVVAFFREVYQEYRSEAIVLLYYNEQKESFAVHVPYQKVNGLSLEYLRANTMKGHNLICSIHSHAGISAFHSGTDKDDERAFDGLHITVGNVNDQLVSIEASIAINGYRVSVDPMDYIDGIDIGDDDDEFEEPFYMIGSTKVRYTRGRKDPKPRYIVETAACDEDWMDKVEGTKYEPPVIIRNRADLEGLGLDDLPFLQGGVRFGGSGEGLRGFEFPAFKSQLESKPIEDKRPLVCRTCPFGKSV